MNLAFTPEHEELIRTLRRFARKELAPRSAHWDRTGEFPREAWRQMGELGLLGLRTPAAYGGQDADLLTFGLAMEEIARGDFACTYGLQLAGLAGEILGKNGSEEIKTRWLPSTAGGRPSSRWPSPSRASGRTRRTSPAAPSGRATST